MTQRERVRTVLSHNQPDRVPCDFGGCSVTGMHASVVYALRQALRLDEPGTPVRVVDPFQILGEVAPDLCDALDIDTVPLMGTGTFFGYPLNDWKPWQLSDGTPVLVPGEFSTETDADGRVYQYPGGDTTAHPSGMMPKGGHYFDALQRSPKPDFANLSVEENTEEFGLIPDSELAHLERESKRLYDETSRALFGSFPGGGFGDIAWLPAPFLKEPKGIRDYTDWFMSFLERPEFVRSIFERQCEIALQNLERLHGAVGNRIELLFLSGADYGTQSGLSVAPPIFEDLFLPFYKQLTGWIHEHTTWKVFVHSCGAIKPLLELFIEAGFDVINPVQCSAVGMDPQELKNTYGDQVVFWGGGVDTQHVLPTGTPDDVKQEVADRIRIFGQGGGYVFNTVHNVQPGTPTENLLAMFEAYRDHRDYE